MSRFLQNSQKFSFFVDDGKGKGKGKVYPKTGHEGPEGE